MRKGIIALLVLAGLSSAIVGSLGRRVFPPAFYWVSGAETDSVFLVWHSAGLLIRISSGPGKTLSRDARSSHELYLGWGRAVLSGTRRVKRTRQIPRVTWGDWGFRLVHSEYPAVMIPLLTAEDLVSAELTQDERQYLLTTKPIMWAIALPIWALSFLFFAYPIVALIRGPLRRWCRRRGCLCIGCGYDLTGNVSGACPECGSPVSEDRHSSEENAGTP
jgi:hypothetical protein